ncbi:MAG: efflux RND transporter permease subunit [Candidatus Sumerlaeia bacterium]|nr:efflux RND transporter permease subunit [Candidatus Sumerlaeia bacterium]
MAAAFVGSRLTPLLMIASLLVGVGALLLLPREEEPQIRVPIVDVFVSMPGSDAPEIETRVTYPMEKLLWELPDVEYIYSTSRAGGSLAIVRFEVGTDLEEALVRVEQKLRSNYDRIPHGVAPPLVKPRTIDDVPVLALTLHSQTRGHLELRRIAAQLDERIKQVPGVAETTIIGGARRQLRVLVDPVKLAARNLSVAGLVPMLQQANRQNASGAVTSGDTEAVVEAGSFLRNREDVERVVVGVYDGRPIYLRDVAEVLDGAGDPEQYVLFGRGAGTAEDADESAATTISVAKRPGVNAIALVEDVTAKVDGLRGVLVPPDVEIAVTRDYGHTAAEKSDELLLHMGIAVVGVSLLIMLMLGLREAVVVALAIPATLALTLAVFHFAGYTLNRVTLFALIFSIGILVDDAIVVIENIVRHFHLPESAGKSTPRVVVEAVAEVGNPTVLATWAVIAAIAPMAFVGGLMGPYMRPIPVGASAAMVFSLLVAFSVTPWAAALLLKRDAPGHTSHNKDDFATRVYRRVMRPLLHWWPVRWGFLVGITALFIGACYLVYRGDVKVKMLPFDNKSEFQIILNMPEGSSLERTAEVAREIAAAVRVEPEVADYQIYAGTAAPFNFNGLVRHYFLRAGANVADIQVNLLNKEFRDRASHGIAKAIRPRVAEIAARHGAAVEIAEVPPGPPVLQTLVAEIYGPTEEARLALATEVKAVFERTSGVVDVDWYVEADQRRVRFLVDQEKAALHGISAETVARTLVIAVGGASVDLLRVPHEREDVNIVLETPRALRTTPGELLALRVRSGDANALPESAGLAAPPLVPLRELVRIEESLVDKTIHHKNLMPVTYVTGDVAGAAESPAYAIFQMNPELAKLDGRDFGGLGEAVRVHNIAMPTSDLEPSIKWDGEWQITLEVFRDLGIAFAAALVLIYLLMVGWFKSFGTPVIVMAAIPFSLVGILPAHAGMDAFFTATSMIGFMAGAGIVARNSIILVDFIELRLSEGMPLEDAVVDAGAVRFRPMLLTAMAVVVGASVILFDPIFQGLAISLLAGEIASLLISRMAVPVLYFMAKG